MGRYSMHTPCSERKGTAALVLSLLLAVNATAAADCAPDDACAAEAFVARLITVADEKDPAAVLKRFDRTFGVGLASHTLVFVSALLDVQSRNDVVRFVRLGDEEFYPLSFGREDECVALGQLDSDLTVDGWTGGRITPETQPPSWLYRKGRTQLTAHPRPGDARCTGSILLTYRNPK